jgi:hypothetical protein
VHCILLVHGSVSVSVSVFVSVVMFMAMAMSVPPVVMVVAMTVIVRVRMTSVMLLMLVMMVIKTWSVGEGIPWSDSMTLLLSDARLKMRLLVSVICWVHCLFVVARVELSKTCGFVRHAS